MMRLKENYRVSQDDQATRKFINETLPKILKRLKKEGKLPDIEWEEQYERPVN